MQKAWLIMNKEILRLYLIASSSSFDSPLEDLETAFEAGVTCFQLREKGTNIKSGDELFKFAQDVKELCGKYNVTFIVNDNIELAEKVGADGVHIGQGDVRPQELPEYFIDKIIGLSVGNLTELEASTLDNVSYLGVGPVYNTTSKDDAGAAIGLDGLKEVAEQTTLPVVAIGGITAENYKRCLMNGADGVSVISAITKSSNIAESVTTLLQ